MISILEYSGDLCHVLDIWPNAPLTHYTLCRTTSCLRNAHGRVKTPPGSLSPHLLNMGLHEICASKLLVLRGGSRSASTSQPKKGADFSQVHQTWHQTHTSFGQPVLKHMSNASCIVMCHTKRCSCEQASFPSGKYIKAAAVSVTAPHFCGWYHHWRFRLFRRQCKLVQSPTSNRHGIAISKFHGVNISQTLAPAGKNVAPKICMISWPAPKPLAIDNFSLHRIWTPGSSCLSIVFLLFSL